MTQRLQHLLEPGEPQCIASGYTFTEGPLWDPAGRFYFADVRDDKLYRIVPGGAPELVRETCNGNGTCFDLQGRIVQCEGLKRRVTCWNPASGTLEVLVEHADGKKFNRPNDVICHSNGDLLFSDPAFRDKFLAPAVTFSIASSPADFAARINRDSAKWGKVIKDAGIKAE